MLNRLLNFLNDHIPIRCVRCGSYSFAKHAHTVQHRVAGFVRICAKCNVELYGE